MRNRSQVKPSVAHTSRSKPPFLKNRLGANLEQTEVCFERCAQPCEVDPSVAPTSRSKLPFLRSATGANREQLNPVAHTSRSKPPFLGLGLGFETLGFKVQVGSRYDPPYKLEKGDDFIDKVVERLQLLSKASGFKFRV